MKGVGSRVRESEGHLRHAQPLALPTRQVEVMGARLRAARLRHSLSLRSVAESVGVSASLISQVENGKTRPSVSTLWSLVTYLGISIDEVLTEGDMSSPVLTGDRVPYGPVVQRGADNTVLDMENGVRWEQMAGRGGAADAILVSYEPGASSSVEGKLMRHTGFEYAYLIEGTLTLHVDGVAYELEPGDSLFLDSARPHLYSNPGHVVARGIWFVSGRRPYGSNVLQTPIEKEKDL